MKGNEIREKFLGFFEARGHARVRSSSLIPAGDATLLFTNAGMNQFKDVFLGTETRDYRRAASAQKCLRVSGKHNDFDQVGRTARHHTFFEMLGNFSFGDYFKDEAIALAWELVTREYQLPKERLHVTVFREDDEAAALWKDIAKLPSNRIRRMDEKDNFWAMGETGPCGPCSEIYYDQGPDVGCGSASCAPGCACDRYLEFWNLVFVQFDRRPDGSLMPLASPSIDTGAGLERLAAILQGVKSNYRSDLFMPLIDALAARAGVTYGSGAGDGAIDVSLQVMADHLRALCFLIADGVVPSNEKRGYILRRIIRRALTYGRNVKLQAPFLHEMTASVVAMMGPAYPELATNARRIAEVCRREEDAFVSSLARGMAETEAVFARSRGGTVPPETAVMLWTTYGVTLEIQQAIAVSNGVQLPDQASLDAEMERHREAARASWQAQGAPEYPRALLDLARDKGWEPTAFLGYSTLDVPDAKILALAGKSGLEQTLSEGARGFVVLDRTPYYAESGGQVGDTGQLRGADGSVADVDDAKSPVPGMVIHAVTVLNGSFSVGDRIAASVDPVARAATMRNHTATHLLHAALKNVLGSDVQQAGSYVGPDRLRFDFNYPGQVGREALERVEDEVNTQILRNTAVVKRETSFDDAMKEGAIALFGEKYGNRVRVVTVPGYSQELCGGTHCEGTGDIGFMKIIGERGIAAGVRRVEALTGMAAFRRAREDARIVTGVDALLKAGREGLEEAVVNLLATQKMQTREIEKLKLRLAQVEMKAGAREETEGGTPFAEVDGVRLIARKVEGLDRSGMRHLADNLKKEAQTAVVVLASETEGKVALLAAITEDLAPRLDARLLIKDLAAVVGGSGGGNKLMAEAGGRDAERIPDVLAESRKILSRHLASAPSPQS